MLYNCTATRPAASGSTKNENIEPQTETTQITATSIYNAELDKDIVKASTSDTTAATLYDGWFDEVYQPAANAYSGD